MNIIRHPLCPNHCRNGPDVNGCYPSVLCYVHIQQFSSRQKMAFRCRESTTRMVRPLDILLRGTNTGTAVIPQMRQHQPYCLTVQRCGVTVYFDMVHLMKQDFSDMHTFLARSSCVKPDYSQLSSTTNWSARMWSQTSLFNLFPNLPWSMNLWRNQNILSFFSFPLIESISPLPVKFCY